MNPTEYDKINSALLFILDVVIDLRLSRSRDFMFLRWYVYFNLKLYYCSVFFIGYPYDPTFRLSDLRSLHIGSDNRCSTVMQ